jgi:SAM-dependent methyltransferase
LRKIANPEKWGWFSIRRREGDLRQFLHVGCGQRRKADAPPGFRGDDWSELRFDIDPSVAPDILGTMTDLGAIASGSLDSVYSSHNIEHLFAHEAPVALREFWRVLKDDGFVVISCPDLKSIAARIVEVDLAEPAYISKSGPITPLDMIYGHGASLAAGYHYMAHRSGYTKASLAHAIAAAGFASVSAYDRPRNFVLWAVGSKRSRTKEEMRELQALYCA